MSNEDLIRDWDEAKAEGNYDRMRSAGNALADALDAVPAVLVTPTREALATTFDALRTVTQQLTAERDAALAVIEKARVEAGSPIDTSRVNDNHAGRALWKAACLGRVDAILSSVPSTVLAERIREAQEAAWNETVEALAWAIDNGPDPLAYVAANNPYTPKEPTDD